MTRCDNHTSTRPHPAFCVSQQVTEEQRAASLNQYLTDQEDRKLAQVAAGIESDGYRKWPRVQETILFAKRMGYHKIGHCHLCGPAPREPDLGQDAPGQWF